MEELNNNPVISDDKNFYGKKIKPAPVPEKNIGVDNNDVIDQIMERAVNSVTDLSALSTFTQAATSRNQLYQVLDIMAQDSTISAILETYAEDATETNDKGQIVWATSEDANAGKYVNFLLESMQVDKHIYGWAYSLIHYGDLYFELFRESDDADSIFNKKDKTLNEDIKIIDYKKSDHYIPYIEAVQNPAKMFELTRLGKTSGFIKADNINDTIANTNNASGIYGFTNVYKYNSKSNDIEIYGKDKFVHAILDDNNTRFSEQVTLFNDDKDEKGVTYKVRKGQSLLYNSFKIWRELSLLENSVLLNRVTKSSIVRLINVEVGDMPKENVGPHLQGIKALMEQKSALDTNNSMTEYTNPGPIENNIYVPTYDGKGAITTSQVGGDVNITQLPDIEYFQNKFFGSMRVPKQYFGLTDDGAGFNGGQSLSIISSRYAKSIKKIQNALIQALTTTINLMLVDKGQYDYINKFTIHMQEPTTQEEIDRRENESTKIAVIRDLMDLLADIEDQAIKLKILKGLISDVVTDDDIMTLIQEQIDALEDTETESESDEISEMDVDSEPLDLDRELDLEPSEGEEDFSEMETETDIELPTPEETGIDMTGIE